MIINVIQEDIDSGVQRCSSKCPMARAISRVFNKHLVYVCMYHVDLVTEVDSQVRYRLKLPDKVGAFIHYFDGSDLQPPIPSEYVIKPFSFDLQIPDPLKEEYADLC